MKHQKDIVMNTQTMLAFKNVSTLEKYNFSRFNEMGYDCYSVLRVKVKGFLLEWDTLSNFVQPLKNVHEWLDSYLYRCN